MWSEIRVEGIACAPSAPPGVPTLGFLKQGVKRRPGVVRVARRRTVGGGGWTGWRAVARHCYTRFKQHAVVGLVLDRNSCGDRLHALKSRRRFKADTLFTTVKIGTAFGTLSFEIEVRSELGRAVETA